MTDHKHLNSPAKGHGLNGANKSFFKAVKARKALKVDDEKARSERFYRERAEYWRQLREAQEAARCGK